MSDFNVKFSNAVPVCNNDYNSLRNKPSINGVTMMGDVVIPVGTTNYNDLSNKPSVNGVDLDGAVNIPVGTTNYNDLSNKPSVNGVDLEGAVNIPVGTTNYNELSNKPSVNGVDLEGAVNIPVGTTNYNELLNKPQINGIALVGNITHVAFDKIIDIPISNNVLKESLLTGKTIDVKAGDFVLIRFNASGLTYNIGIGSAVDDNFLTFVVLTGYTTDYMLFGRYDNGSWRLYRTTGTRLDT